MQTVSDETGPSTLHQVVGAVTVILGLLSLVSSIGVASLLGGVVATIAVFFSLVQIGVGIALLSGAPGATTIGKIYYGISAVLALFTLNFIGVVLNGLLLVLVALGDS